MLFGFRKKSKDIRMIDMHNHMLYGVDDGSENIEMSLKMLQMAMDDGVVEVVVTPHFHPRRGKADVSTIQRHFYRLKEVLDERLPNMKIHLGREVYYSSDLFDDNKLYQDEKNGVNSFEGLVMADTSVMLIEFSTSVPEHRIKKAIENVFMAGLQPIVAHVERYACIVQNPDLIGEYRRMGALIQINADSVLGKTGNDIRNCTKKLLKNHWVDFVATDAHDLKTRTPVMSECYRLIEKKYGAEYAERIFYINQKRLIADEL